ncbi:hypothetical protein AWC38_SpisGene5235 [Stylophora pistillata]|uniref:Uncharacterized protein n=1 Tax=Stylophora pistillata TaxID=50429 RepID=A0A2B4SN66_STYPI|nr:hypothetical protein AWC38_SpisGene5235 [Stylophora pistillata]
MAPKSGGKSDNFSLTTAEQWNLELPTMLAGTGSMYWSGLVFGIGINISAHYDPCAKRLQSPLKGSKSIDSFFSLSSTCEHRDDTDVMIATEQTEDFEGVDDVILDK